MPFRTRILIILALFLTASLCVDKLFGIRRLISSFLQGRREEAVIRHFEFSSADSLEEWDRKVLRRNVTYRIDSSGGEAYVHAISDNSCSAMYYKIRVEPGLRPILSWKWRVEKFPDKRFPDDLSNKEEDDFAARMYVIFSGLFFSRSKVLEYIWAKDLESGAISSSPYSDNIKLIVAESGPGQGNEWVLEERDIYEDYVSAFGAKPKLKISTIAFMCDSDSTDSRAEAYFDEIKISIKK